MGGQESLMYTHARVDSFDNGVPIYRNPDAPLDLSQTIDPNIQSVYHLFEKAKNTFKFNRCLGTKTTYITQDTHQEEKQYNWMDFEQTYLEVHHVAHIIRDGSLFSEVEDKEFGVKLNVIGISSVNRQEWLITDLAANLLGITTVPLYETLGQQMLQLILSQTEMSCLFGNSKSLENILTQLSESLSSDPSTVQHLRKIVCFDQAPDSLCNLCNDLDIQMLSYQHLITEQKYEYIQNQPEDYIIQSNSTMDEVFTISYTSGTEKNSKGVILTNRNFLGAISNILKVAGDFSFNQDDTYLSYLPLAHVFDRLGCHAALSVGAGVGFYGGNILQILDDLQLLKPTIFVSVPRLLNKVYDRIIQSINQQSFMKKWLFNKGLNSKLYYLEQQGLVENNTYDTLIFNKVKERLGGRVRIMITASAPIAGNILNFLKCVFCCPIIEAYGQTESCGASFCTKIFDNQSGHVGGPAYGIEYKLKDVDEMNYTQNSQPYPCGEVMLRGPSIFPGYFKNKELTEQTLDSEGWLHTGDVGQIGHGNTLRIVDRIKNIFKLSQGEYIVTEKLERVYEQSMYVAQCYITGDSLKDHIVAIIYPELTTLKQFCDSSNLLVTTLSSMISLPQVRALLREDLQRLAVLNQLNSLEQVRDHFTLVDEEFQVGTVLTPTMKIRRQAAKEQYQQQIQQMYNRDSVNMV